MPAVTPCRSARTSIVLLSASLCCCCCCCPPYWFRRGWQRRPDVSRSLFFLKQAVPLLLPRPALPQRLLQASKLLNTAIICCDGPVGAFVASSWHRTGPNATLPD